MFYGNSILIYAFSCFQVHLNAMIGYYNDKTVLNYKILREDSIIRLKIIVNYFFCIFRWIIFENIITLAIFKNQTIRITEHVSRHAVN